MTLREIFNSILDYQLNFQYEVNPWAVLAWIAVSVATLCFMYWWYEVR